jgi:hypothetical protein
VTFALVACIQPSFVTIFEAFCSVFNLEKMMTEQCITHTFPEGTNLTVMDFPEGNLPLTDEEEKQERQPGWLRI